MTVQLDPYEQSYPPSLWAGGGTTAPVGGTGGGTPSSDVPDGEPTQAWTKAEIIAWLDNVGVTVDHPAWSSLTKAELLGWVQDVLTDSVTLSEG